MGGKKKKSQNISLAQFNAMVGGDGDGELPTAPREYVIHKNIVPPSLVYAFDIGHYCIVKT